MPNSVVKVLARCSATMMLLAAAASPALAQEVRTERAVISHFVERSMRSEVWFYHAFDENCGLIRGFNVAIDRMPRHGDVALNKVDRVIDESFINKRDSFANIQRVRRCFGRSMPVIVLHYTGNRGYSGFDDLQTVVTSADRLSRHIIEFKIGVQ